MSSKDIGHGLYADDFFGADVTVVDPLLDTLIRLEEERQTRRLILIPSESYAPQPVRQALGSVFTNIYAEGYPPSQMVGNDEELLADMPQQLAYYRRYADRRFYKGADYVHFIEVLAQRRAAACFANESVSEDQIFVNVQPLSGAVANLAVYEALLEPGDTLMGMDLYQGGHLTHGSEFNVSGKRYQVVSYGISRKDQKLDYDQIRKLAETSRPKIIVAGYTSYPWAPDFRKFRDIADSVGAYLLADVSHPAGMVVTGQYPTPVGIADVVTFTTHKTLCGPRGACILTTDVDLAAKIDQAVFPGLQGGPHTNKFAAMCVTFEIARTQAFRDLQQRIVENAGALAKGLTDRGLKLAYGGTDTHLLLVDLKSVRHSNKQPLYGEVVARILELAGIVVNKNTIPWDTTTAIATGIRIGTPWVSQRGMGPAEMDTLADCIARIIQGITPFYYEGLLGRLPRGKIDLDTLEEVKWVVDELAGAARAESEHGDSDYPHYSLRPRQIELAAPVFTTGAVGDDTLSAAETVLIDSSDVGIVRVSGWRAQPCLNETCTADIAALEVGQGTRSFMLDKNGRVIDDVTVLRLKRDERERDAYLVLINPENFDRVVSWLRGISDGYIVFDDQDVWRKVQGPAKVEVLSGAGGQSQMVSIAVRGPQARELLRQVFNAGSRGYSSDGGVLSDGVAGTGAGRDARGPVGEGGMLFDCSETMYGDQVLWVTDESDTSSDKQYSILGFLAGIRAVWDALERAGAKQHGGPEARWAAREAVGLPPCWPKEADADVRDGTLYVERAPRMFAMSKPYFVGQSRLPRPSVSTEKRTFTWEEPLEVPLKRTPLYEEHKKLGAKLVPFAGWEMPVWYTSVGEEHRAVRETAGLFDVTHMGTLGISGPHAADFLDLVSVNYARWITASESQYGGLLDADGQILDDIWIYRRAWDSYFVVVNASNFDKDFAWLNAVNRNEVIIDRDRPWVGVLHPVTLSNLKDPAAGVDQRVDIALQGPNSLDILLACTDDPLIRSKLTRLQRTRFFEGTVGGIDLFIARTGYTGEDIAYELYVHPDKAVALWRMLLEQGATYGVKPCGLASRDSTRIEAGLPLYGHELSGPLDISQSEAGFEGYVKYHKPFFVGRVPYKARHDQSARRVIRFQVSQSGARALRGGEHGEPIVSKRGKMIGTVTSCTLVGGRQIGLALVGERYTEPGMEFYVYPQVRKAVSKAPQEFEIGDTTATPVRAVVLTRFREKKS